MVKSITESFMIQYSNYCLKLNWKIFKYCVDLLKFSAKPASVKILK